MSDPKRYRFFGQVTQVDESGNTTDSGWAILSEWVEFKDYARLKAENERLRKAGDEVVSRIVVCTEDLWCSIHRWNAAKDGKPTE